MDAERIGQQLVSEKLFERVAKASATVPNSSGLYAVRVLTMDALPPVYAGAARARDSTLLYVGIASLSLADRMLAKELGGRGHGTLFRSLGAMLGERPSPGSLAGKKNQNNYTFTSDSKGRILHWVANNVTVSWVAHVVDLAAIETAVIRAELPLLNLAKNPSRLKALEDAREECRQIARSGS